MVTVVVEYDMDAGEVTEGHIEKYQMPPRFLPIMPARANSSRDFSEMPSHLAASRVCWGLLGMIWGLFGTMSPPSSRFRSSRRWPRRRRRKIAGSAPLIAIDGPKGRKVPASSEMRTREA